MSLFRREFLKRSALGVGAAALGKVEFVQADDKPQSSSPNERMGVAVIGAGGRGGSHLDAYSSRKDTEVLFVCDVDEGIGQGRLSEVGKRQDGRMPQYVKDFRTILDNPNVDIITTATPNHWHALIAILALQAGKHVYVEKPVSHNVSEGRHIVNWARKMNLMCQCGTQSRSSPSLHEAHKWLHAGNLGKIQYAIGTCYKPRKSIGKLDKPLVIPANVDYDLWCGPAAMVDLYRPRLHYDWHWDWNTGNGDMGNQGIHQMDIARWFLGESTLSPQIMSVGGRLGYDDAGNTPNSQTVIHLYEKAPLIFETRGLPESKEAQKEWKPMDNYRGSGVGVIVQCEQGYLLIPSYTNVSAYDNDGREIKSWKGGGDHFGNLVDAIRSGKTEDLNGEILEGHLSSGLCHTGGISHQLGRPATAEEVTQAVSRHELFADSFDRLAQHLRKNEVDIDGKPALTLGPWLEMDVATETFRANDAANKLLTREYRKGYEIPVVG